MKAKAKSFFDTADLYTEAARVLFGSGLFIPSVVNAGLALELYFKALYMMEFGSEFKKKNGHSHDFLSLFDDLKPETQSKLIEEFKKRARFHGSNATQIT